MEPVGIKLQEMMSGLKKREESAGNDCVYNLFMDQSGGRTLVLYISKIIH